jgi:hypothetical protein
MSGTTEMMCKEDLIGTEWKCPNCTDFEIITNEGIVHHCVNYSIVLRLEQLFDKQNKINETIWQKN